MALNIPKVMQTFTQGSVDVQRLYNNVSQAVNPLLAFVGNTFVAVGNNVLRIIPDVQLGNANIAGNANVGGNVAVTGNEKVQGTLDVTGRITAINDLFINGRVAAVKSGFKSFIPLGYYYNGSYTVATGYQSTVLYTVNTGGTVFQMPILQPTPFFGSLVGITALYYGQSVSILNSVQIRGMATTPTFTFTSTGQPYGANVTYARGTYPIVAGQALQAFVQWNTAGNNLLYIGAVVEWDT